MTFWYIVKGIIGALICGFTCGGWYLIDGWIENISLRRWNKKMAKQSKQEEKSK